MVVFLKLCTDWVGWLVKDDSSVERLIGGVGVVLAVVHGVVGSVGDLDSLDGVRDVVDLLVGGPGDDHSLVLVLLARGD